MAEPSKLDAEFVSALHRLAMEGCDIAAAWRREGRPERASRVLRDALTAERQAAALLEGYPDFEPTRSVIYRSAASLAWECGDATEARRLATAGLAGNPPDDIAAELREILEGLS